MHHPDKGNDAEVFKKILNAYTEIMSCEKKGLDINTLISMGREVRKRTIIDQIKRNREKKFT